LLLLKRLRWRSLAIAAETFLNQQKKNGSLVASLDPWCSL